MKKKILAVCLIAALVCTIVASFAGCSAKRENTLRIANWGEYMSKETYDDGFVKWYEEKTGEKITVEYTEFDTNENLYTWISAKHEDYDLMCPSDYMLQRMISEGLVNKIDAETLAVINASVNGDVINMVKNSYDASFEYSLPYVWGTLGIMFNTGSDGQAGLQNELESMSSWSVFWDAANTRKIFMKDSVRDAYSVAMLYAKRAEIAAALGSEMNYDSEAYKAILNGVFDSTSPEQIALAKKQLLAQKSYVYNYEVDSGKDDMVRDTNGSKGYFGLFWSCDAGYVMSGSDENSGNKNLYYVIPNEGSNVWVDSFAIPKYAKNTKAANLFLQYLCETEVGYECMDYVGSTTAIAAAAEQYKADLIADEDGFFANTYAGFKEMYLEMMFPSSQTLKRCAIMKDFGQYNEALDEMWVDVTLD